MAQLIYLIGASGSGKDSLMQALRDQISTDSMLLFAHRYITRPAEMGGENYVSLSDIEFKTRLDAGLFVMNWNSHGNSYAIGTEINDWLKKGFNVIVNGSREYLTTASERFPDMLVVLIQVSPEKLRERLLMRGRESNEEIEKRLQRSQAFQVSHPNLFVIDNDKSIEHSTKQFLTILQIANTQTIY